MAGKRSFNVSSLSTQELRLSLVQRRFLRAALLPMVLLECVRRPNSQPCHSDAPPAGASARRIRSLPGENTDEVLGETLWPPSATGKLPKEVCLDQRGLTTCSS